MVPMVDSIGVGCELGIEALDANHGHEIVEETGAVVGTSRYGWGVIAMMVIWRLSGP